MKRADEIADEEAIDAVIKWQFTSLSWTPVGNVLLNPERELQITTAPHCSRTVASWWSIISLACARLRPSRSAADTVLNGLLQRGTSGWAAKSRHRRFG
ncbi:hypothetical protein SAMN04488129_13014 [Halomonas daqiaonensis]|uniref:Uncharacterized protein n=1 Tax=Halomonas daqiaonensis TaxID=650850 RepID=A0A1H7W8G9_9GAMM|nr:hypothetical protein SAMN04488129_13014 [Halomonas daqiaonensis]